MATATEPWPMRCECVSDCGRSPVNEVGDGNSNSGLGIWSLLLMLLPLRSHTRYSQSVQHACNATRLDFVCQHNLVEFLFFFRYFCLARRLSLLLRSVSPFVSFVVCGLFRSLGILYFVFEFENNFIITKT